MDWHSVIEGSHDLVIFCFGSAGAVSWSGHKANRNANRCYEEGQDSRSDWDFAYIAYGHYY